MPSQYARKEFHGDMTRLEAIDLLSEAVDGAYFVRRSKNLPGKHVLSMRHRNSNIKHFPLSYTNGMHCSGNSAFKNLEDLVNDILKRDHFNTYVDDFTAIHQKKTSPERNQAGEIGEDNKEYASASQSGALLVLYKGIFDRWAPLEEEIKKRAPIATVISCEKELPDKPSQYAEKEFHGDMTRPEAEDLLSEAVNGGYFVRRSKNLRGKHVLSMRLFNSRFKHALLSYTNGMHCSDNLAFKNLEDLVNDILKSDYLNAYVDEFTAIYQKRTSHNENQACQIGGEDNKDYASVPVEIVARGIQALEAYHRAIEEGKISVKRVPIMFIGQSQSGKTSLKRSLKGEEFNLKESSTIGIETDPSYFKVSTEVWKMGEATHERDSNMEPFSYEKQTAQYIVNSLEKNKQQNKPKLSPSHYDNVTEKSRDLSSKNDNDVSSNDSNNSAPKVTAVPEEIVSLVTKLLQVVRVDEDKDEMFSTLWDFGGQSVYYSTHPIFLTRGAIYLLVYNLSRNPEEKSKSQVKRGLFKSIKDVPPQKSNMDHLDFWMSSVSSLVPNSEKPHETPSTTVQPELLQPPVILVFTHADKPYKGVDPEELASEIFGNLQKKSYGRQILDFFVVDNTKSGSKEECAGVIRLRKEVLDTAKKLLQLKEIIPIKWLKFEKAIKETVEQGSKWIYFEDAKRIAVDVCGISTEEQFLTMLNLLHDQRILIHFDDTPELNKIVILDPQWLIDVFKEVITIPPFKKSKREHRELWRKLEEKGILEKRLLKDLWDPFFDSQGNFDVNSLINMMEKFGLLCPWPSSDASGSPSEYLVPSMLMSPPKNVTDLFSSAGIPSLFVKFKSGQSPIGLFPRLVLIIMQWCAKEGLNQEHPQLRHHFVRFYTHPAKGISLILLCRSSFIEVVVHQGKCKAEASKNERMNLPSVLSQDTPQVEFARSVCRQLGLILECMRREFHWLKNMAYEMSVCCPICCTRKRVKYCETHQVGECKEEECLHFWSESQLYDCQRPVVCTRGLCVGEYRVPLERFAAWFPFLHKTGVTGEGNQESAPPCTEGEGKQALVLSDGLVQALQLRTCNADGVVAQFHESLSLDLASLEQPDPETKRQIRCICLKAKSSDRLDVVKRLREIAPAGTTGPLLPEACDVANIPIRQRENLTIHLSGGKEWQLLAERLGLSPAEIRFLDNRVLNPCDAALAHAHKQGFIRNVGELYDKLVECDYPTWADLL